VCKVVAKSVDHLDEIGDVNLTAACGKGAYCTLKKWFEAVGKGK
jgi:hypothetical protein